MNTTPKLKKFADDNNMHIDLLLAAARAIVAERNVHLIKSRLPKPGSRTVEIDIDLLESLYMGLTALKTYIDQVPVDNPVMWIADRKIPVSSLPDYDDADQARQEAEKILYAVGRLPGGRRR